MSYAHHGDVIGHPHRLIADRIRTARVNRGLSQTDLAKLLGVNRATIAHWERDDGFNPNVDHLRAISVALQIGVDWLTSAQAETTAIITTGVRSTLELQMVELSKHLPVSFLTCLIALMENAKTHL
ncbi:MAG: helix-turn-helix domain-containing protein [Stenotrophomonas sp.]|uniref:helix-turn-helix domain-containing protein n=1 Tax=Stenotrophomonas sp. TaxID=69392 RepID=UPI003D6D6DD2